MTESTWLAVLSASAQDLNALPPRERVFALEEAIKKNCETITLPVRHFIAGGVYARELSIPAGTVLTGYIHKHEHVAIVSTGDISVYDEHGLTRIKGPHTFISRPGIKRAGYAHEDTLFITIHRMSDPSETDIAELEKEFVTTTYTEFDDFMLTMKTQGLLV